MIFKKNNKSEFQKLIDDFYKESEQQDYRDKVFLETERLFVAAWVDVCNHLEVYPNQQVDEFEDLIKQGIEMQWGPCSIVFNREKRQVIVKARDGRCVELVSWDIITEDAI